MDRSARPAAGRPAEILSSMAQALNQGVDLGRVIDTVVRRGVALLGGADGAIFLLDRDRRVLRGFQELSPLGRRGAEFELALLPHTTEAIATGAPVFVARPDAAPAEAAWMDGAGVSAGLVAPLVADRCCLGVLYVNYPAVDHHASADDLRLAASVAEVCALAIARAQLFEAEREARARAEATERAAQAWAARLAKLQGFTAALSSAVTMRDVAAVLSDLGLEEFGARAVGIMWMMQPGRLELVFGRGVSAAEFALLDRAARAGERLPVRDAIVARRAVWLESPDEIRARYPALEELRARRGESGCAVVPLVVGDRCAGIIGFTFAHARRLAADERAYVETLAQLAAQAFDRARLFEAEQEARREAERIGALQEQLMAVVGHDLRTPLSSVRMGVGLLARRGDLAPEAAEALGRVATSAARMNAMIADLLDFSRVRRGLGVVLRLEPVDLAEVARRALAEVADSAQRVSLELAGDAALQADPVRLAQLVANLLGNALQHGAGAPVRLAVTGREAEVELVVHNDGPPISPDVLPHIFEPFRRGQPPPGGAGGAANLGLGLFIVREIVAAHGGRLDVRSGTGSGTTFTAVLPRAPAGA